MKLNFNPINKGFLVLLLVAWSGFIFAQRTVQGIVTDGRSGEPLIGASVLAVGTNTGAITDFDGTYELEIPTGVSALEFSYTGYADQVIALTSSNVVNAEMSAGTLLDEVVVVGYGSLTSKEVTSSVVSVKAEDFNQGAVNDPTQLLQGKVAGLQISKPGGDPNGGFNIRLRGLSTVGANAQPLIIIDGVPGASLNSVDPNDIASMDILKDGSAAAIYGTRGASGVILITTKSGKAGKTTIDYNAFVAADIVADQVDALSSQEFLDAGGQEVMINDQGGFRNDFFDEITRTGISQVHNLSASGGIGKSSYRASLNYRDVDGVAVGTGFQRLNGRLNLSQKALNDRLTLSANIAATSVDAEYGFSEAFRYATTFNPTSPVRSADPAYDNFGGYYQPGGFDYFNPVAIVEQGQNDGTDRSIFLSGRADYELIDGLTIGTIFSRQIENQFRGEYYRKDASYRGFGRNGLARRSAEDRTTDLFEATVNYDRDFGKLNFKGLGGYSFQEFFTEGLFMEGGNFLIDDYGYNNITPQTSVDFLNGLGEVDTYRNSHRLIAFFGRAAFNYDNTYFLSASVRQEGSSRFGVDNKWGLFPAVSGGVTLSNLFEIPEVNNLKLRAGYGVTGAIPNDSYLSIFRYGPTGNSFFYNGAFVPAFGATSNPNPDLKWETKGEFNVGLDFALLDYRLTGSVDFYDRTTTDGILLVDVPSQTNIFDQTWQNVGGITNTGLELALNYAAIQSGDLTWDVGGVFSTYSTELTKFTNERSQDFRANLGAPGQNGVNLIKVEEGQQIGQIIAPNYEGLDPDTGLPILTDLNGDGSITQDDFVVVGQGLPKFELGFTNTFRYGNFDLNFFLRGSFGHSLVNTYRAFYEFGDVRTVNVVRSEKFEEGLMSSQGAYNSSHVEKADFLKLDNATFGYTFDLPKESSFRNLRLYVSGQNLFVITNYSGVDPEVRHSDLGAVDNGGRPANELNPDILSPGIDRRNTYFRTRTLLFGVNVGF